MNKKIVGLVSLTSLAFSLFAFSQFKGVSKVDAATEMAKQQIAELMAPATTKYSGSFYNSVTAKSGKALRDQLHSLIRNWNTGANSYDHLYDIYKVSDLRPDGTIWDTYGDFAFSPSNKAGTYKKEGDCYNREHSIPASWFNDRKPMYYDAFHLMPTDGYVNNRRSNNPFGEVSGSGSYHYTFNNYVSGTSKSGSSVTPGISGTVFEPADCYKGDYARNYFYFITCYFDDQIYESAGSSYFNSATKNTDKQFGLTTAARDLLIKWHTQDPVSQKEVERCEAVYSFQNNRNPFIDHPEFVDAIWGNGQVDIDPGVDVPTLSIYNGSTKLTSDTVTINVGDTITLYGYKNSSKDGSITYSYDSNDVVSITKIEYYYPQITGLKAGSMNIIFKLPYNDNGTTKYVTKTITVVVKESGTSTGGGGGTTTLDGESIVLTISGNSKDGVVFTDSANSGAKITSDFIGYDAARGMQVVSKDGTVTISNLPTNKKITGLKIKASSNTNNWEMKVSINNSDFGDTITFNQSTDEIYTISGSPVTSDTIKLIFACPGKKSVYLKSFEIFFEETGGQQQEEPTLVGIESSGTCKQVYNDGESFDPTGLTISAIYSDESTKDVTSEVIWNTDVLNVGTETVIGTYEGKFVFVDVTVNGQPPVIDDDGDDTGEETEEDLDPVITGDVAGCEGSVVASSLIISTLSLAGLGLVIRKKKEL